MTATISRKTYSPWATFAVCGIASYISTLDMSIVNVAFFEIHKSFPQDSAATISWVVTAYSILFGSLLIVSGRLADQIGRKKVFLVGEPAAYSMAVRNAESKLRVTHLREKIAAGSA